MGLRTLQIYLETTMFNYYFDAERDAHSDTVKLFNEIKAGKYQAYTSVYAIEELMATQGSKRDLMIGLIAQFSITVLERSLEAEHLVNIYLNEGVVPASKKEDARHIAIASVHNLDMILSLNFKHIVRKKTIDTVGYINKQQGYQKLEIFAPMEVVNREDH